MKNMNIVSPTATRIYAAWKKRGESEEKRNYLGASIIGHECEMYLWLMFRNVVNDFFDGRMYRLFDRGKREERVFCEDLRSIGCTVKEFDDNGKQFAVSAFGGHWGGHLDAVAKGFMESPNEWHVVEYKTHSNSSFQKLCKDGVRKAKPTHYAQMQSYMGHTGLVSAIYMAVDKDTDDLWIERVKFDKAFFYELMEKAKRIIDTTSPERCASRPDDFRCKACPCRSVCWHEAETFIDPAVPLSCKTCCHATAVTDGEGARWSCRLGHECSKGGCPEHLILPVFVKGELMEGDERGILYSFKDDKGSENGITIGVRGVSEDDAKKLGPMTYRAYANVKENFPKAKVVSANTLQVKYSGPGFYDLFNGTVKELKDWAHRSAMDFSHPDCTEEIGGVRYFEYRPGTLVVIDGERAKVITDEPPF